MIKKALIITNTASMVHLFNSVNIGALQNEGYEVHSFRGSEEISDRERQDCIRRCPF